MANFHFYVSNVTIYGLGFYNCGEYSTSGTLYFQHAIHLWVDYIKIQSWHTYTTAIQVNNGSGRLIISHSEFLNSNVDYWNAFDVHLMIVISKSIFEGSYLSIH